VLSRRRNQKPRTHHEVEEAQSARENEPRDLKEAERSALIAAVHGRVLTIAHPGSVENDKRREGQYESYEEVGADDEPPMRAVTAIVG